MTQLQHFQYVDAAALLDGKTEQLLRVTADPIECPITFLAALCRWVVRDAMTERARSIALSLGAEQLLAGVTSWQLRSYLRTCHQLKLQPPSEKG